jgi:hypothetical protein
VSQQQQKDVGRDLEEDRKNCRERERCGGDSSHSGKRPVSKLDREGLQNLYVSVDQAVALSAARNPASSLTPAAAAGWLECLAGLGDRCGVHRRSSSIPEATSLSILGVTTSGDAPVGERARW